MINFIGKTLAVVFFGVSVLLMSLAGFMLLTDFDFGWREPQRVYNDKVNEGDKNLLVPSDFDKAEAAMRKMVRYKEDELYQLGMAQQKLAQVEPWLGKNKLKSKEILDRLENGTGTFEIDDIDFDDAKGFPIMEDETPGYLGFFKLTAVKREHPINKSYATYLDELRKHDAVIDKHQKKIQDILAQEQDITMRLIGLLNDKDEPDRNADGSIKRPGWYYLIEMEIDMQKKLEKEIEYLEPLRLAELVAAQNVVGRRDLLLARLNELGEPGWYSKGRRVPGYFNQYQFLKSQLQ